MSDEAPRIELPLTDDYKELQRLGEACGLKVHGVSKVELQAMLRTVAEQQKAEDNADPRDADARDGEDQPFDACDDCFDPGRCEREGCQVFSEEHDDLATDEASDAARPPDGDWRDVVALSSGTNVTATWIEDERQKGRLPITRTGQNGAWWCPACDHCVGTERGNPVDMCPACSATRDGDEVVV